MRNALRILLSPTALLCLIALSLPFLHLFPPPERAVLYNSVLLDWLLPLVLAAWVIRDARIRRRATCYDYGAFVFFAWPLLIPAYLFQTRGPRAFLTLGAFLAISAAAIAEYYLLLWALYGRT